MVTAGTRFLLDEIQLPLWSQRVDVLDKVHLNPKAISQRSRQYEHPHTPTVSDVEIRLNHQNREFVRSLRAPWE